MFSQRCDFDRPSRVSSRGAVCLRRKHGRDNVPDRAGWCKAWVQSNVPRVSNNEGN